ncbi:MAG TPA: hypothetical protein VL475_02580, partial [Planctomycetaceae bacterium]|nr:hypothetical protein [Planctomycetaceae bacterium]
WRCTGRRRPWRRSADTISSCLTMSNGWPPPVLCHRLIVRPESRLRKVTSANVVNEILTETSVPTLASGQSAS